MAKVPLVRQADYDTLKGQYDALLARVDAMPKGRVHRTARTTPISGAAVAVFVQHWTIGSVSLPPGTQVPYPAG